MFFSSFHYLFLFVHLFFVIVCICTFVCLCIFKCMHLSCFPFACMLFQGDDDLERLVSVFAVRQFGLWKQADVLLWLHGCCRIAARAHDLAALTTTGHLSDSDASESPDVGGAAVEAVAVAVRARAVMVPFGTTDSESLSVFGGDVSAAASTAIWLRRLRHALFRTQLGAGRDDAAPMALSCVVPRWLSGNDDRWTSVAVVREALQHYNDVVASGVRVCACFVCVCVCVCVRRCMHVCTYVRCGVCHGLEVDR
jgi:hypothetical protein